MREERIIRGIVASVGTAIGKAVRTFDPLFVSFNFKLRPDQVRKEVERFRDSVEKSREQLKRMQSELKRKSGPESSFLIDAHLLVLQDRLFVDRIIEKVETDYINSEWAIQQVSDDLFQAYDRLNDEYLRERRGDLDDIVRRLLHNLQSKPLPSFKKLPYDAILVGKLVPPSTLSEYRSRGYDGRRPKKETGSSASAPSLTEDRVQVSLGANINFSEEVRPAIAHGCESIGLYRTEFDFFREGKHPDEEALTADYL